MKADRSVAGQVRTQLTEEEYACVREVVGSLHMQGVEANQCTSVVVQRVNAPLELVWSLVRRFDKPQAYKNFIRSCQVEPPQPDDRIEVGSIRHVNVVSGLPATSSTERLEMLDEERHVLSFSVLGGEHRLKNYRSTTSLHEFRRPLKPAVEAAAADSPTAATWTLVIESYVVDVPDGNTTDDTSVFVDTVVRCNLQSLALVSERLAHDDASAPSSATSADPAAARRGGAATRLVKESRPSTRLPSPGAS